MHQINHSDFPFCPFCHSFDAHQCNDSTQNQTNVFYTLYRNLLQGTLMSKKCGHLTVTNYCVITIANNVLTVKYTALILSLLPPCPTQINPSLPLLSFSDGLELFAKSLFIPLPLTFTCIHAPAPSTLRRKLSGGRKGSPVLGWLLHYPACSRSSPMLRPPASVFVCNAYRRQRWEMQ